jgi:pantetheine-phosphate adenylyltransferase
MTYLLIGGDMMKAIFPGSFDPITLGHFAIIEVASIMFEKVFVAILNNINKSYLFSLEERINMVKKSVGHLNNVEVIHSLSKLTVDLAMNTDSNFIIRGLRGNTDLEFEMQMNFVNKKLVDFVHTIFVPTDQRYIHISSSAVRELIKFGCSERDLKEFVPEVIIPEIFRLTGRRV